MAFTLWPDDCHLELRTRARETANVIRNGKKKNQKQKITIDEVWDKMTEIGFPGFLLSKGHQEKEQGLLSAAIVVEEFAAEAIQSFFPILFTMGCAVIARFGSKKLKEKIVPRILSGGVKFAIASTERESGFNVLNVKTRAEKHGDYYLVNGSKIYVSGADIADYMIVVTRTITHEECERKGLSRTAGISLLLINTKSKGIKITPIPCRGESMLRQYALELENVPVPDTHLIGEIDFGVKPMFYMFNPERTLVGAMALGITRYSLKLACAYARVRRVFGDTPIAFYQSVQHPLAQVAVQAEAVRLMTYRSAWLFDNDAKGSGVAHSANCAKYLGAELALQAVDVTIDAFGGKGFDETYGIIQLWETARLLKTSPISNALILNQIAAKHLGLPRSY
jgi:acyl-CoA dehydrogenase